MVVRNGDKVCPVPNFFKIKINKNINNEKRINFFNP